MIRKQLMERQSGEETDFRHRGTEVSRLEGFSDAVFAFAITLIVVSLEVPNTFDALLGVMRGFIAFGICFGLLIWVWYQHYIFFRRYGLQDTVTIWLNGVLLFVVVFYIYPLKFLFTIVSTSAISGITHITLLSDEVIRNDQMPALMIIYGLGFMAVFGVFGALHLRAFHLRGMLGLNPTETLITQAAMYRYLGLVGIGLLSITIVLIGGANAVSLAGFTYFLIPIVITIVEMWLARRIQSLKQHAS